MFSRINFLEELIPEASFELNDVSATLSTYGFSTSDIVNFCGGIPAQDITSIRVVMQATHFSAICVKIITYQYEIVRNMDFEIGRIDNNFMAVKHPRHGLGTKLFLTQVQTARRFRQLHATALAPDDDLKWTGYYFGAEVGYENMDVQEYQAWASTHRRNEATLSELMQSESGRQLWRRSGFTWIGNFYLSDGHRCLHYLRQYLKRKGIECTL